MNFPHLRMNEIFPPPFLPCENELVQALKTLEDARPVFQIAAELRSAVLREAAKLVSVKHRQMTILSIFCRAWIQFVTG